MASSKIILYDLPSKGRNASWSLNPWKTRLALNFKGIDYETQWVEYPDVEPTLKSFGIQPNDSSNPAAYTIPAVRFEDGTYVMDSAAIIKRLDALHPSPSLPIADDTANAVLKVFAKVVEPLRGVWMPLVPLNLLNPRSAEYFQRTREKRFGIPLNEYAAQHGGDDAWAKAEGAIKQLGDELKKTDGPFILGNTTTYADFYIVAFLQCLKRIDEELYQRIITIEPALGTLFNASKQWLERDDH